MQREVLWEDDPDDKPTVIKRPKRTLWDCKANAILRTARMESTPHALKQAAEAELARQLKKVAPWVTLIERECKD